MKQLIIEIYEIKTITKDWEEVTEQKATEPVFQVWLLAKTDHGTSERKCVWFKSELETNKKRGYFYV